MDCENYATVECWYKGKCERQHDGCRCLRYEEMLAMFEQSNIPQAKWGKIKLKPDIDYPQYARLREIKHSIRTYVKSGNSLYLYSKNFGNGKTSWAIKLMQAYFNSVWAGNRFKRRGIFFSIPEFIDRDKLRMDRTGSKENEDFEELRESLTTCDLVVWDDVSAVQLTDYSHSLLLNFIDARCANSKCNIYTGNLDGEGLALRAGGRLASRIWNGSEVIEFKAEDHRSSHEI